MLHYQTYHIGDEKDWVVFLHGLGGNSRIWYKQLPAYRNRFNLLLIDFFGHGQSTGTRDRYSFESLAIEVTRVMDHLGIESAHVIGISLGTIIQNALARVAPDRIKSMVLGGGVMGYDNRSNFLLKFGGTLKSIVPYMWLYRFFAFIMMPRKNHRMSRSIFIREARKLGGREFCKWYRLMERLTGFYSRFNRKADRIPRLFISGSQDHLFLPLVKSYCSTDPLAALHVVDKCGHVCNIEQPDEFNDISIRFFKFGINRPASLADAAPAKTRHLPIRACAHP